MSGKVYLGSRVSNLDTGEPVRISRVNLLVDSGHVYTAGDNSGRTIEKSCPWGTQAMADSILAALRGVEYRPYSGLDGFLDPAAEVGDGVTVGGMYSVLGQTDLAFDAMGTADVSAPGGDEAEDEYPYKSRARRQAERELAQTRSMILKKADEITLKVENEVQQLSASFTVELDRISSTVTDLNGSVKVTLDTLNGLTVKDSNGTTRIKGSSIDTSTIRARSISASQLNLTGALTFSDLNASAQSTINGAVSTANSAASTANSAYNTANSAYSAASSASSTVQGWCYPGTTEINGAMIRTGTVEASILRGGRVDLMTVFGVVAGSITIERSEIKSTGVVNIQSDELTLGANHRDGRVCIEANGASAKTELLLAPDERIYSYGTFMPGMDMYYELGLPRSAWSDLYIANDPIVTSDRTKKENISYDTAPYDALFDALRPASFRLINGQSGRTHLGLIAQDVEEALSDCGLTDMDFAGFIRSPRADGNGDILEGEYDYALRYGEFISLLITQTQKLKARVAGLERRIAA